MKNNRVKFFPYLSICLFVIVFIFWCLWQSIALPGIQTDPTIALILDSVLAKGILWALIPLVHLKSSRKSIVPLNKLFTLNIPWLPFLVALSLCAAFLNTIRILNGLVHTHIFFDYWMIVLSLSAGVFEEIGFRGCFFNIQDALFGFWPAALINGLVFVLFHYPRIILGDFNGIVSLRTLLIFVMGVIFCWIFKKWKCLPMNILLHTAWDIMSYLFCLV